MQKRYGLLGYPLGHSFSKVYFEGKLEYENYPYEDPATFVKSSEAQALAGFNVTIPHKQTIIPLLDHIDAEAQAVGAVNCVKRLDDGGLKGYNTDVYGFEQSLLKLLGDEKPQKALILGSGGAAKAVEYVLKKNGILYSIVSRSGDLNYENLTDEMVRQARLIVNTTPLGMPPDLDTAPEIPYKALTDSHFAYDLIYNPTETLFLKKAAANGAKTLCGLEMLHLQADKSLEIWNSQYQN